MRISCLRGVAKDIMIPEWIERDLPRVAGPMPESGAGPVDRKTWKDL